MRNAENLNEANLRGRYDELRFEIAELENSPSLSEDNKGLLRSYRTELVQVTRQLNSFYM